MATKPNLTPEVFDGDDLRFREITVAPAFAGLMRSALFTEETINKLPHLAHLSGRRVDIKLCSIVRNVRHSEMEALYFYTDPAAPEKPAAFAGHIFARALRDISHLNCADYAAKESPAAANAERFTPAKLELVELTA